MKRLLTAAAVLLAAPAAIADASVLPPVVIDTAPDAVVDIAIAPDGTGGLVYTKGGQVWAALAQGAGWSAPFRVDPGDADVEGSPRVAAGNGGRVLFGYHVAVTDTLKWRLIPSAGAPLSAEDVIRVGAGDIGSDWDVDMNPAGVAYAAWIEADPVLPRNLRAWRLEGDADRGIVGRLQKNPDTEGAGGSSNGPDVRVAVDAGGDGAVLFTQNDDQAYVRRLDGVAPSDAFVDVRVPAVLGEAISGTHQQLDLDMAGNGLAWAAGNGNYPTGGHAIGVPVTGAAAGAAAVFDLHPASENDNAERPDVALNTAGAGLFAAEPNQRTGVWGGVLRGATAGAPARLDVSPHEAAATELPVASIGEDGRGLVAWTRDVEDGAAGPFEVRARAVDGTGFAAAELLLSSDGSLGRAQIAPGVTFADGAGSTRLGDTAVLMLTDDGATRRVVVGRYDAPPTAPVGTTTFPGPAARPRLTWTTAQTMWSPLASHVVRIDGATVATLGAAATSFTPGADLAPGPHRWDVVAVDAAGGRAASAARDFIIAAAPPPPTDTTKPALKVRVRGMKRVGRKVRIVVRAKDAGGIARVKVRIGKADPVKRTKRRFTLTRRFGSPGPRAVKAVARDRAGNARTVRTTFRIRR